MLCLWIDPLDAYNDRCRYVWLIAAILIVIKIFIERIEYSFCYAKAHKYFETLHT